MGVSGQAALMHGGLSFPGQPQAVQAETRGADQAPGWDLQLHRPAEEAAEGAVALPQKVSQCSVTTQEGRAARTGLLSSPHVSNANLCSQVL